MEKLEEIYPMKSYLHFDKPIRYSKVQSNVENPEWVAQHAFLPFIKFKLEFCKIKGVVDRKPDIKSKEREIMYASHIDNYIYKYYSEKLNEKYNQFCAENGIDECVIAYRNNKNGCCNIDFAAEIINKIVEYESAYILIGDFKSYFDEIDHAILKKNLRTVLKVDTLSKDWYQVYKTITHYGYYKKEIINQYCQPKEGQCSYFKNIYEFRKFQKMNQTAKNIDKKGIPQGSAISAVLANVFAINLDIRLQHIAESYGGCYRRYSDDYILVLPKDRCSAKEVKEINVKIINLSKECHVTIQEEKTGMYVYENKEMRLLSSNRLKPLNYLGFIFDGKNVSMRGKSVFKFYRNAKKLIKKSKKIAKRKYIKILSSKNQKSYKGSNLIKYMPYKTQIYALYTDLGPIYHSRIEFEKRHGKSSFIDYAKRCQRIFDQKCPYTNNLMMNQIKNRKRIIESNLGYHLHVRI